MNNLLTKILNDGETIISNIMAEWPTVINQRQLIQLRTALLTCIADLRRKQADRHVALQLKKTKIIGELIASGIKKSPAEDDADDQIREEKYELEKDKSDVEIVLEVYKNRAYHLRISEIDLMKIGLGSPDLDR